MERIKRTLRLARLRGDLVAIAVLESRLATMRRQMLWTEAELREAWGK